VYKSVLFVPPTPKGELAKQLKQREAELNKNSKEIIKIVETRGLKMETAPTKYHEENPMLEMVCNATHVKIDVWKKVYEGETARSAKLRGYEHLRG
jgi:ribosome maturation protein Sdo1